MKKSNNKGYMLVEIIVAFSLAIAMMYIITELTIRVKNRNDDLRVRTLTASDQAIIYNMIMSDNGGNSFSCKDSDGNNIISGKKITYNGKTNIVNEYVDEFGCDEATKTIHIGVKVLDDNFDVVIPNISAVTPPAETPNEEEEPADGGNCWLSYACDYDRLLEVRFELPSDGLLGYIGSNNLYSVISGIRVTRRYGFPINSYFGPDAVCINVSNYCFDIGNVNSYNPDSCSDRTEIIEKLISTCNSNFSNDIIQEKDNKVTVEVNGFSKEFTFDGKPYP